MVTEAAAVSGCGVGVGGEGPYILWMSFGPENPHPLEALWSRPPLHPLDAFLWSGNPTSFGCPLAHEPDILWMSFGPENPHPLETLWSRNPTSFGCLFWSDNPTSFGTLIKLAHALHLAAGPKDARKREAQKQKPRPLNTCLSR